MSFLCNTLINTTRIAGPALCAALSTKVDPTRGKHNGGKSFIKSFKDFGRILEGTFPAPQPLKGRVSETTQQGAFTFFGTILAGTYPSEVTNEDIDFPFDLPS